MTQKEKEFYESEHCPACNERYRIHNPHKRRTTHHIWPQHFFKGEGPTIYLCQDCHTELHREIPTGVMLEPSEYQAILDLFLFAKHVPMLSHS
jgi:hypothetical protein